MVYVTAASKVEAEKIVHVLLEERLIVCVNILGPVSSHFHWEGQITSTEEYLMIIKTEARLFARLEKRIRDLHSYTVPEVIVVPIIEGSKDYFNWMTNILNC